MEKKEYQLRLKILQEKAEQEELKLAEEYAFSNNPYKIGDVITDHYHTIRIKKIKYVISFQNNDNPSCYYSGPVLTKAGNIAKSQIANFMYQSNIKKEPVKA